MKKFICKSIVFCFLMLALISCTAAFISFGLPIQFHDTYQHALSMQYDSLRRMHSPKVVIMGDSAVPFSLNAPLMEKKLGMPVQTLGIHSGTGLEYILNLSKANINKGDIMVVELEPSTEDSFSPSIVLTACENNFSMYRYFSSSDWRKAALYYPSYLIKKVKYSMDIRDEQNPAYSGMSFDRNGNYDYYRSGCTLPHHLIMNKPNEETKFDAKEYSSQFLSFLNDYNRYCKQKGATFLISFPPFLNESLKSSPQDINDLQRSLSKRLEAPIITKIADRKYPRRYMFNNISHCNSAGADVVTKQLAREITIYLRKHNPDTKKQPFKQNQKSVKIAKNSFGSFPKPASLV